MSLCLALLPVLALSLGAQAQGVFLTTNAGNQTRLGSLDGAFAGTNIYGLFLAGPSADSLVPVGFAAPHFVNGGWTIGRVSVPTVPAYSYAFVQLVAWDSLLWGIDFAQVPTDQIGRTDVVSVFLTTGDFPDVLFGSRFTQPAIVPVPEPAAWALLALAGGVVLGSRFAHRRRALPK